MPRRYSLICVAAVSYTHLDVYKRQQYEGSVKVTQAMNSTIVEYIGGIEVIKAFNQGKNSYAKFTDRVKACLLYTSFGAHRSGDGRPGFKSACPPAEAP